VSGPTTPRSQPDKALAAVLRRRRDERGLTAEAVAQDASLTLSAYLRIEAAASAPGWSTVKRIAEALDLSLAELVALVEAEGT
jgi:transcriptional regulator with XRE-family HTH domain